MKYFILSVTIFIFSLSTFAQDFHVTTTGDDEGSGSETDPWESIQHAMDYATVGSTVFIHGGTYNERVYVNVSGEENAFITFKNNDDQEVVLDGTGLTEEAIVALYDVHHVAIEGLKIRNNIQLDAIGIVIEGASDNITIKDCEISNIHFSADPNAEITEFTNAQAVIVYGTEANHSISSLKIMGNEIHNCRLGYSEGLALNGNVDNFIIEGNSIHDLTNIGIDIIGHEGTCPSPAQDQARAGVIRANTTYNCLSPYATAAGIYVDGGKDLVIERNHVYNNQWGIEIGCENIGKTTSNIIVRNNFIYQNSSAGMAVGGYDYPNGSGKVESVKLINNSFFGNDTQEDWTGELFLSYNEYLVAVNNIFYADNANGMLMSDDNELPNSIGTSFFYNLWYHPAGAGNIEWSYQGNSYESLEDLTAGTDFGIDALFIDPLYTSVSGTADLHILDGSPAINAATAWVQFGPEDIDGEIRFVDNLDMGADEFGSTFGILEETKTQISVFPNPCIDFINFSSPGAINQIVLRDQRGKIILTERNTSTLDVSVLSRGLYFLELVDNQGLTQVQKLLKH